MDDSFAFRTTVPLRRRFDPTIVRLAVFTTLVVLGLGSFANWVVASERNSFSRSTREEGPTEGGVVPTEGPTGPAMEAAAVGSIGVALDAAKLAFSEHRSFLDAGPAQLSVLEPGYTFVDGPSTMPEIVSVAATADTWAAAVQAPGGSCHWVRATAAGEVTRGFAAECSGSAALSPPPPR
jgi:hypothetical protein